MQAVPLDLCKQAELSSSRAWRAWAGGSAGSHYIAVVYRSLVQVLNDIITVLVRESLTKTVIMSASHFWSQLRLTTAND